MPYIGKSPTSVPLETGDYADNTVTDAKLNSTKLDGIETAANVTDTSNVIASLTAGTNMGIASDGTLTSTDTIYTHPNHSGDVVSTADGATVIQADAVDIAMLSATGTASSSTYLRGDNTWGTVSTDPTMGGDMSGTASNAQIVANAVGSTEIANGAVIDAKIGTMSSSKLTGALPAISGAALTNLPGGGKVLQVIQATLTSTAVVNSSTYVSIGLSASITPSSTSSKILVMYNVSAQGNTGSELAHLRIERGGSSLLTGDVRGSRASAFTSAGGAASGSIMVQAGVLLDSPATTSAQTYNITCRSYDAGGSNQAYINRSDDDPDNSGVTPVSTITLMEIGA